VHAETIEKLISRLTTAPISLPPTLLESLDLVVFLGRLRYKGKNVRKIHSVHEFTGFDVENNKPRTNKVFEWNPDGDIFEVKNKSHALFKVMKKTGLKERDIVEEVKRRMAILDWMNENNIINFIDVGHIIDLYYDFPDQVLNIINGEV
jgi:flagellar protein FlaI